jgi:serine protease Do
MRQFNIYARCLALLLAALMLTGMLAAAEPATQNATEENPSYDIVYSSNNPIPEIAERVRPAIVQLNTKQESWDPATRVAKVNDLGGGSACYIRKIEGEEPGCYMLTNYHVVKEADAYTALWLDGTETDLELVGYDDGSDIAVLKFKGEAPGGAEPIPMGDSDALRIGELAIIIGNPGTADEVFYGSVTAGIISGLEREGVNADNFSHSITTIQTDAPINGGNSGGALLNAKGEMVGIPTLKYMTIFEGLTFCIPISVVKGYIDQIIDNGSVVRPRMGVTVTSIDGPDEAMKRYPPCGAQVYTVEPGTPADKAGLMEKDVITEANGARIKSSQDLVAAVDRCGEGQSMELTVYRYNYDADGNVTSGYEELHLTLELQIID